MSMKPFLNAQPAMTDAQLRFIREMGLEHVEIYLREEETAPERLRAIRDRFAAFGLTIAIASCLPLQKNDVIDLNLTEKDGQPVNDIAKRLYLETNTVTPLLKRMEKEGLLERSRGTEDARQVIARLTEQGRDLKKKAAPIPGRMGTAFTCNRFSAKDAGTMARWLDEIIQTLS